VSLHGTFFCGPLQDDEQFQRPLAQPAYRVGSVLAFRRQGDNGDAGLEDAFEQVIPLVDALPADAVNALHDEDRAGLNLAGLDAAQEGGEVALAGVLALAGTDASVRLAAIVERPTPAGTVGGGQVRLAAERVALGLLGCGPANVRVRDAVGN
jgi:hypothetical protein